ncbi:MAG: DUF4249 domain-containing protein [Bacteroidota bacterium]
MNTTRLSIRFFILISLLLFLPACEKDVILDLADVEGNFIVVDANITDGGGKQWVRLSRSSSYYDISEGEPVSGASVLIEGNGSSFLFNESEEDSLKGFYYNDQITYFLEEGEYTLTIGENDQTYTGQSEFKPVPQLDSISLRINAFSELGFLPDTLYDVLAHFEDLATDDNYYLFNMFRNDTIITPRPADKGLVSDINLTEYVSLAVLNLNKSELRHRDQVKLEIRSISRENFDFYAIFFSQTDLSGNPFAGAPPANIPTNMSEGAKGFFQVSAIDSKTLLYTEPGQTD